MNLSLHWVKHMSELFTVHKNMRCKKCHMQVLDKHYYILYISINSMHVILPLAFCYWNSYRLIIESTMQLLKQKLKWCSNMGHMQSERSILCNKHTILEYFSVLLLLFWGEPYSSEHFLLSCYFFGTAWAGEHVEIDGIAVCVTKLW